MAQLAIKGHPTRGNEVIEILEMLGGVNAHDLYGDENYAYYTIERNKEIKGGIYVFGNEQLRHFTLEEFEEKFPYKIGDNVRIPDFESEVRIDGMLWDGCEVQYYVFSDEPEWYSAEELNNYNSPYEEETKEEQKAINHVYDIDIISFDNAQKDSYELDLKGKFEIILRNGKYYAERIKPLFLKTYEECCDVLELDDDERYINVNITNIETLENKKFEAFIRLSDAYWKIAGEEMGLNKPWEPDWSTEGEIKYVIEIYRNNVRKNSQGYSNTILAFPTIEIRDIFFDNFKDLIEECKELL